MPCHRFGRSAFAMVSLTLLLVNSTASVSAADEAEQKPDLRSERVDALRKVVELAEHALKSGRAPYEEVYRANVELLDAELDYCRSNEEAIAILKRSLKEAAKMEDVVKAQGLAGRGSEIDVQRAKAQRLKIEIALRQAEANNGQDIGFQAGDPVFYAKQQVAMRQAELKMARAQTVISAAKAETLKASVSEAVAIEALEEQKSKNVERLFEKQIVSGIEVQLQHSELEAAKSRRIAAEGEVVECQAQIQYDKARVELAELALSQAKIQLELLEADRR
ncbi:hypothetical protein GC197_10915 [bacterium]|nr:hypothetical protein [bacterium]